MDIDVENLHNKVLYPVVRCMTEKAGGTGITVYSRPVPKDSKDYRPSKETYETYILTAEHVVDDCIEVRARWDPVLKKEIKKETKARLKVEFFDYEDLSTVVSSNEHDADIVAYDKEHDIALLKVDSPRKVKYVAKLLPKTEAGALRMFQKCWAAGCSLGHNPIAMDGHILSLKEDIANKNYFMYSAHTIFGNSGGAVYTEDYKLFGISARITGLQLGFGIDIMTWMGFLVPIERIYEFIDEQLLQFLYDSKYTSTQCFKEREKKEKEWKLRLLKEEESGD